MTLRYRVVYEPLAQEALIEAVDYLTEKSGQELAEHWLAAMLDAIDGLETFPRAFPAWTRRGDHIVYTKLVQAYRVFYVIDDASRKVHVIDVVHTARETKLESYRVPDP